MGLVIINSAVDSLYFSYKGIVHETLFSDFEMYKKEAKLLGEKVPLVLGDEKLLMNPYGSRSFRYGMTGANFFLLAGPSDRLPTFKFQMLAASLYQNGHEKAFKLADGVARACGTFGPSKISRIDLCVDVQGWALADDQVHDFVCRANQKAAWWSGSKPNGFQFGKGAVLARIYNKAKEIEIHNKGWMEAVWNECPEYDSSEPVWRVEFQFKREALKELKVDTVEDALTKLKGLWDYGLTWLSLRSGTETRKERRPIDENWAALSAAGFTGKACERVKATKGLCEMERALSQLIGYTSTLGALWNTESIIDVLNQAIPEMERICEKQGISFAERVQKKIDQGEGPIWW